MLSVLFNLFLEISPTTLGTFTLLLAAMCMPFITHSFQLFQGLTEEPLQNKIYKCVIDQAGGQNG